MSRQTRASVNTCIVLVVSSAGSEWSILDAVARGKGPARFRPALPEPPWEADEVPIDLLASIEAKGAWGLPTLQALLSKFRPKWAAEPQATRDGK